MRQGPVALELALDGRHDACADHSLVRPLLPGQHPVRDLAVARVQELAHGGQRDDDVAGGQLGAGPDEGRREGPGYVAVVVELGERRGPDGGYADDTGEVSLVSPGSGRTRAGSRGGRMTYMSPMLNRKRIPIFFALLICRELTTGIGMRKIISSAAMLKAVPEMAMLVMLRHCFSLISRS